MPKPRPQPAAGAALELGERLRRLRQARGLSVRALASMAGVTAGTLSKIENRQTSPSVGTLKEILDALGATMSEFFAEDDRRVGADQRVVFRPVEQVKLSSAPALVILGLPHYPAGSALRVFHEAYAPGADTGRKVLKHTGEDAGFCLSGTLELVVDGRRYLLGPGDGFHFRSERPHRWRNVGKTRAELITACTPPTF